MFPKDSAFKQAEKQQERARAHRARSGQIADERIREDAEQQHALISVSRADLEEVYRRLNDLYEAAEGGNFKTAGINSDTLADIRDLVYRNLP